VNDGPGFWTADLSRIGEVAAGGVLLFIVAVVLGRVLGKRSMAQMNNFDWLIAVASGSLLATGVLARDISIVSASVAMATLGICQFVVTKFFAHEPDFADPLKADPRLLVHKGFFLREAMEDVRVTKDEIYARLRAEGIIDPAAAQWVVMEADGRLTVIPRQCGIDISEVASLEGVTYDPAVIQAIERDHGDEIAESEQRFTKA
jgi:uncharacterized membrane protein YcaP (DUF421 family)